MKKHLIATLTAAIAVAGSAQAGQSSSTYTDRARVVDVEPIVRTVRVEHPRRECWDEEVRYSAHDHHHDAAGGMIVGGVIGGLVGHAVGRRINKGRGKHGATLAGTLIGAAVGHGAGGHGHGHGYGDRADSGYRERCRTYVDYSTEERVDGYWVTYRYKGEEFRARMRHDPGDSIPVRVRVIPLAD